MIMDSNQQEDSKSSSEEIDQLDQANDDIGMNRSYECVFCKRGFTTAQALGGHMNIHRKDRAKTRPSSSPNKVNDNCASFRPNFQPNQSYSSHYSMAHEVHVNYHTLFPESTWDLRHSNTHYGDNLYAQSPQTLIPLMEDWPESLGLRVGPPCVDGDGREKREGENDRDDGLDLELRLGHDP